MQRLLKVGAGTLLRNINQGESLALLRAQEEREHSRGFVDVDGSCPLYFTMGVVRIGWSWGLHFCQNVVEHGVRQGLGEGRLVPDLGRVGGLVRDGEPASLAGPGEPVSAVYMDGAAIIGLMRQDAQEGYNPVMEAL